MTRLVLICGSREASPEMLALVRPLVKRLAKRGDVEIVVGDAGGVDERVVMACLAEDVYFHLYTAANQKPRLPALRRELANARYWKVDTFPYIACKPVMNGFNIDYRRSYLKRDEVMVNVCDSCIAIWSGYMSGDRKSTGTYYTYRKTQQVGKPATLVNFCDGEPDEPTLVW